MYTDNIIDLEDQLRKELIDIISDPTERSKAFTAIKRYNHNTIKAVLNDFRITLENKEESIISKFPIE